MRPRPRRQIRAQREAPADARWYKDAILYELHVRSFQDSIGDGIGDFPGLTARLPYLQDLGVRIRCHGNLHLGQFLHMDDELVIIDFDGEPGRPLYERRLKRSPLQDVATMVRSFHCAAHAALRNRYGAGTPEAPEHFASLPLLRPWQLRVGAVFIDAYSRGVADGVLLPFDPDEARVLFHCYILERALYELGFELNHRPTWVTAPLLDLPYLVTAARSTVMSAEDTQSDADLRKH